MREIVLDTETTGLDPVEGHRIVEIGAVELWNHLPTGQTFHHYVNPERDMPDEAFGVHGIGPDLLRAPRAPEPGEVTLRDKPVFAQIGAAFLDFVGDARLVIHNAAFDLRFLNAELHLLGLPQLPPDHATDTLAMARQRFPGSPATLDALCRRFAIDTSARDRHGALLDAEILAEVYLELIGGRQPGLVLGASALAARTGTETQPTWRPRPRPAPLPPRLTEAEAAAHGEFVATLGADSLWRRFDQPM